MEIEAGFTKMNFGSASSNSVPINLPIGTYPPASSKFNRESFFFKLNPSRIRKERFLLQATTALEYYNLSHGDCFELVDCLFISDVSAYWQQEKYYHLSFIARRKDPSLKIKLFFAEFFSDEVVKACTPVEPGNPLFCLGCGSCHPKGVIYHPVGNYKFGSRRYFDSPPAGRMDPIEKSAKKWLNENYSFEKTVEIFSPGEHEELSKITHAYALEALRYYCYLWRRDYELSEILASVRFGDRRVGGVSGSLDDTVYVHVNFMAKNKDPHCNNGPSELFFAELTIDGGDEVINCENLMQAGEDAASPESETETRCKVCRLHCDMVHPKGLYYAGINGGIFADAQNEKGAWGVKADLQEKEVGTSRKSARVPDSESDRPQLSTCLPKGRSRKKLAARRRRYARLAARQSKESTSK